MSLQDLAKARLIEELDEIVNSQSGNIQREKAFEIWVSENIVGLDFQDAVEAAEVGGSNDCNCDFFHFDESERIITFGQTKWSDDFNNQEIDRAGIDKYFLETIDHLENCPSDANPVFQRHSITFNDVKNVSRIRIFLVIAGELTSSGRTRYEDPMFNQIHKGENEWDVKTLDDVLNNVVIGDTPPLKIKFEQKPLEKIDANTNKKTLIGFVQGKEFINFCTDPKYRSKIFLENPRRSLLRSPVNKQILATLDNPEQKRIFYKLNNGITACCKEISELNESEYEINNFKIVNGRQTTFAFAEKPLAVDSTVSVELKIHEISDDEEMRLISKCTNSQNIIKASDLVHGTDELRALEIKFREPEFHQWKFELQRGEWNELEGPEKRRITKRRKLEKEPMARRYLGYNDESSSGIKFTEIDIFENIVRSGGENIFQRIFQNREPLDFIVPHIFYVILAELEKTWNDIPDRADDNNLLHQRVVKLHILSFVRNSVESSPNRDQILQEIVRIYDNLDSNEPIPPQFLQIGESAFDSFRLAWNSYAHDNHLEPNNFAEARRHLIHANTALGELFILKRLNQQNLRTDSILTALNNLLPTQAGT